MTPKPQATTSPGPVSSKGGMFPDFFAWPMSWEDVLREQGLDDVLHNARERAAFGRLGAWTYQMEAMADSLDLLGVANFFGSTISSWCSTHAI